jgi:hypothetical protein
MSVNFSMSKKSERVTIRTTEENVKHLQDIQEKYDLPIANTIHRMIKYFAKDEDVDKTFKKLME